MEEFIIADAEAMNGRKNFIIIVLKDKLEVNNLQPELKNYLKMHTYIDATSSTSQVAKRVR